MATRCRWVGRTALEIRYHDEEWGVPVHDDRRLFEFLILEAAQAGLSWTTVLNKRAGYRRAFSVFDPEKVARYGRARIERLLENPGIVRNRLKVEAAVNNARRFREVQREFGSFDRYLWRFVEGRPLQTRRRHLGELPATTAESERLSRDLTQRGFKFVGATICYAFMQATGLVNDHTLDCFRHDAVARMV